MQEHCGAVAQSDAGIPYALSRLYSVLTMVHFASGDFGSARISAERAMELAQNCDEKHFDAYSERSRHLIPIDSATLFRSIAPPHSEAFRHPPAGVI